MRGSRQALGRVFAAGKRRGFGGILAFGLAFGAPSLAGACTLFQVQSAGEAKLKVFFTRFESEDKTGGKYKKCRIVKKKDEKSETFFITPFRQDATVVVHRENWPK